MLIDGNLITWKGNRGSVEASDLNGISAGTYRNEIHVQSPKTGNIAIFTCKGVKRDSEGDIEFWTYHAVRPSLYLPLALSTGPIIELTVWND